MPHYRDHNCREYGLECVTCHELKNFKHKCEECMICKLVNYSKLKDEIVLDIL